jgi:hypothetical protein
LARLLEAAASPPQVDSAGDADHDGVAPWVNLGGRRRCSAGPADKRFVVAKILELLGCVTGELGARDAGPMVIRVESAVNAAGLGPSNATPAPDDGAAPPDPFLSAYEAQQRAITRPPRLCPRCARARRVEALAGRRAHASARHCRAADPATPVRAWRRSGGAGPFDSPDERIS